MHDYFFIGLTSDQREYYPLIQMRVHGIYALLCFTRPLLLGHVTAILTEGDGLPRLERLFGGGCKTELDSFKYS